MQRLINTRSFVGYFVTISIATIATQYLHLVNSTKIGLFLCALSIIGGIFARSLTFFFLSMLTLSIGIGFDYFIRTPGLVYRFYAENGADSIHLCTITIFTYLAIWLIDSCHDKKNSTFILNDSKKIATSKYLYPVISLAILYFCWFVLSNSSNLLSSDFDAYELEKFPFLEYVSLLIFFYISSSRNLGRPFLWISIILSTIFVLICLITSYRMAAIISMLSIIFTCTQGRSISKNFLLLAWLFSYTILTIISYLRVGISVESLQIESLLGYQNGRLDNTFTGVIETALIYTGLSNLNELDVLVNHLIGTILPLPNQLIPDNLLYIIQANDAVHMPGGGLLSGFFIYFKFILAPIYFLYILYAFKFRKRTNVASLMNLILFATITRWWLYGPFVIFKFLGVALVIYYINLFLLKLEDWISTGSSSKRNVGASKNLRLARP